MNDEYVNKGKVVANVAWSTVIGLMVLAWVVILLGDAKYAGMLAAMACASSAYAATLQIRCYVTRLACLVRATTSVEHPGGPRVVRD